MYQQRGYGNSNGASSYGNNTGNSYTPRANNAYQPSSSYSSSSANSYASNQSSYNSPASLRTQTTSTSSFQDRMKERDREKQQREREERDAAARAIRADPKLNTALAPANPTADAAAGPAQSTSTLLWNKLRAAKDVVNAAITGEERWPDSDDSDHEGESHVSRVLREYADKLEEAEVAAKIAALEMTPYGSNHSNSNSMSKATGYSRNQYLRDAVRKEPSPSIISSTSSDDQNDYYSRSLRARGEGGGHQQSSSEGSSRGMAPPPRSGNRYRTTSDASRDDALSRLEGKSNGDAYNNQISHLGSTSPRARAPTSPTSRYAPQQPSPSPSYGSSRNDVYNNRAQQPPPQAPARANLGAYGQRQQYQQQQQQQQTSYGGNKGGYY